MLTSASTVVPRLQQFADKVGASYFRQWPEFQLPGIKMMPAVLSRARSAKRVHFNLDGFRNKGSSLRDSVRRGGTAQGRRTERELFEILSDHGIRDKTTFYRGGQPVSDPARLFGDAWDMK